MKSHFDAVRYVTARKARRCELCHGEIDPGERYVRRAGVFDGDFYWFQSHIECYEILQEYMAEFVDHGDTCDLCLVDNLVDVTGTEVGDRLIQRYNEHAARCGGTLFTDEQGDEL